MRGDPTVTPPTVIEGTDLCGTHSNKFNKDWTAIKASIWRDAQVDVKSGAIPRLPTFLEMAQTYFKEWSEAHARRFKEAAEAKATADPRGTREGLRSKAGRLAAWIRRRLAVRCFEVRRLIAAPPRSPRPARAAATPATTSARTAAPCS